MPPEMLTVPRWRGITRPERGYQRSDRNNLDAPRDLLNVHVTERGHLWMPPDPTGIKHEFPSDEAPIISMSWSLNPRGLFVQTSKKVHFFDQYSLTDPSEFPARVTVLDENDIGEQGWQFWYLTLLGKATYIGYAPRGVGAEDGETWRVEYNDSDPVDGLEVTKLDNEDVPWASDSVMWKGRRFVVQRSTRVRFSELNEPEEFGEDNVFTLGGDEAGWSYQSHQGEVQGMVPWEDSLIFFMTNAIYILSGDTPDTWRIRQAESQLGTQQFTARRVGGGIVFVGGNRWGDRGVYLFNGSSAQKLSDPINEFFRHDGNMGGVTQSALSWGNRYILSVPRDPFDRQVYIVNLETGDWTTFGGWPNESPSIALDRGGRLIIADEHTLYEDSRSTETWMFPRRNDEHGYVKLGWHDDENPTGFVRFLGVKVSGWWQGDEPELVPEIKVSAETPNGGQWEDTKVLSENVFDGLVFPMQLRGNSIDIQIEIIPKHGTHEVLLETAQLIISRKGEKLSRR